MSTPDPQPRYEIVDFANVRPVACPCGQARRALTDSLSFPGTIHRTEIRGTAQTHYHQRLTETYYILSCDAAAVMELDAQRIPLHAGMCIVIPPGVRHRAVGNVDVLIIVLPKFDPTDEVVVDS